jgi:hypothetical protein
MSESILTFTDDISNAAPPPLLPVGPYPAEIIGAVKKVSSTSGEEYAAITFRINADAYPADFTDGDPDGTAVQYNFLKTASTPRNNHRWRVFLEKVGGPLGRSLDLNDLIGLTGTVDISHQDANAFRDEPSIQIARILAP